MARKINVGEKSMNEKLFLLFFKGCASYRYARLLCEIRQKRKGKRAKCMNLRGYLTKGLRRVRERMETMLLFAYSITDNINGGFQNGKIRFF